MTTNQYTVPRGMGRGWIPRDLKKAPLGSSAPMFDKPLIDRSEWGDRITEKIKAKAMLSDVRNMAGQTAGEFQR